ncbi:MAG: sigma-54 dependent transcriptional regulator [Pseudomonadota bacterium]
MERALVVDDEEGIRSFIQEVLEGEGLAVTTAVDGQQARELLDRQAFHLLITDLKMPRLDGMSLLRQARALAPEMEVLVLTAHGTVDSAVEAMKLGAHDYLAKPLSGPGELRLVVQRALEHRRLRDLQQRTQRSVEDGAQVVAEDPAMRAVLAQLGKVAPTQASVLLLGESGTGKDLAARWIHAHSPRHGGAFVAINCAAMSAQLVESELFGHEKGAFTGASERRRGRFELADGGTLFLDEVAELPLELQPKLLRVLQERRFERVGGSRTLEVDVRVVAATNRDLQQQMQQGHFREDLYHRLAVFPVMLPALRDRPADIEPLATTLLQSSAAELGKPVTGFTAAALALLRRYPWPGNVRELGNAVERAVILVDGDCITEEHLLLGPVSPAAAPALSGSLRELEREAIRQALVQHGGHRKRAAEQLGLPLRTLYAKLKEHELD